MVEVIVNDDRKYTTWLDANPNGFVVNTYNPPKATYLKIHRASCRTISGKPTRGDSRTTRGYAKVCSPIMVR